MRTLPLFAVLTLLSAGAAQAQGAAVPPDGAAPPRGTGEANEVINPGGNARSTVNASGTVRVVPMPDLAHGANSFTEAEARHRVEGAGFADVTRLTLGPDGVWRGHGQKQGRTFDVGFDYKGQIAFQ